MFPIKYIDNNLVWNKDNEVFAYYELIPYNYSFLSAEQKFIVHDSFRQLIAQSREGKIHALQIATESSIRSMQEQSKKLVTGKLKEVAYQKIDEQTEALVSMIGDNQVDYRFFLGFKLMVTEEQLNLKNIKKSAWLTFTEFLHEVNHTLMNDFVSMPNDEINRYMKMEKLLENKISRRFKVRRLEINDFGYLMEHLYGRDGIAYEDYEYQLPKKKLNKETLIKYYDLIRPTRCVIEESQRYLRLEHEDKVIWQCVTATKKGKKFCKHSKGIPETAIEEAFVESYRLLCDDNKDVLEEFLQRMDDTLSSSAVSKQLAKAEKEIDALEKKKSKLVDMRLEEIIDKETYESKYADLVSKQEQLVEERQKLQETSDNEKDIKKRLKEFKKTLEQNEVLDKFDRYVFESIVEKVIVGGLDENGNVDPAQLTFVYKTGLKNSVDGAKFKPQRKNARGRHRTDELCSHDSNEVDKMCSDSSNDTCGDGCFAFQG